MYIVILMVYIGFNEAPLPMLWGALAPLVTDVYCMEHREELIPSFTLVCGRKDSSVINCYLFG